MRGGKQKRSPVERLVVPAVAGAALVAGLGRGVAEAARSHDGADRDDRDGRDTRGDPTRGDAGAPARDAPGKRSFLDKIGDRVHFLRLPMAVQKRYGEVRGNNMAASVTLQAFLSLFPLLLVAVAVVGFVAGSGKDVAGSVVKNLGLSGDASRAVHDAVIAAQHSKRAASVVGLVGLLWSGLGLVSALQYAYDQVWQVEARGLRDKAFGLLWLAGAALLFIASGAVTAALRWLPGVLSPVGILVGFAVSLVLWIWTAKVLPNREATVRMVLPGAILGAVGLEILKALGAYYVPHLVASSSQLYGSIGVVFAILAWLLIFSRLLIYSAVLNVVLYERRAGTIVARVEVPRGVQPDSTPDVNRGGRVERVDSASPAGGR